MSESPYQSPYQSPIEPEKNFSTGGFPQMELLEPLYRRRWWVRFFGIILAIIGGLYTLTIFGAVVGVPILICGVFLYQAGNHFDAGFAGEYYRIREGLEKLTTAIIIAAIFFSVLATLMILYFMFILLMIVLAIFGGSF